MITRPPSRPGAHRARRTVPEPVQVAAGITVAVVVTVADLLVALCAVVAVVLAAIAHVPT